MFNFSLRNRLLGGIFDFECLYSMDYPGDIVSELACGVWRVACGVLDALEK